jgi:hypothetical protein
MQYGLSLLVAALGGAGCLLPRSEGSLEPGEAPGTGAFQVTTDPGESASTVALVRGPANFRSLGPERFAVAARFLRPALSGIRRGDLELTFTLPGFASHGRFAGVPPIWGATYVETDRGQTLSDAYAATGRLRVAAQGSQYAYRLQVALDLELWRTSPARGPTRLRLLGFLATASGRLTCSDLVAIDDLGSSVWLSEFDPCIVYENPDLDFQSYLETADEDEYAWANEPWDAGEEDYGLFDDGFDDWGGSESGGSDWGGDDWGGGDFGAGDSGE